MNLVWRIISTDKKKFVIDGVEYPDIITHVHWRCSAVDETDSLYEDRIGGAVPFDILELRYTNSRGQEVVYPAQFDPNNHVPYEDVTDEHMIIWVKNFLKPEEVNRIESALTDRFNNR